MEIYQSGINQDLCKADGLKNKYPEGINDALFPLGSMYIGEVAFQLCQPLKSAVKINWIKIFKLL